jgi:tetratricopeptide (TPR) repeat protein
LVFFALGLLCKPTAVALPFALLLLDYWPLQRFAPQPRTRGFGIPRRLILEKIPLLALSVVAGVVTCFAERKAEASIALIPIPSRIGNVLISYVVYLRQMVWPAGLAPYYPYPEKSPPLGEMALAFLLLAGISGAVLALWRKRPWFLAGWFWYLGMLVPVIGIVQLGQFAHADRNTYLPQIGLYVGLTWAAAEICAGWRHRRLFLGGCATAILAAVVCCARAQTSFWRDSGMLWQRTLVSTTGNFLARNNLGNFYFHSGKLEDAIEQYRKAVEIKPDYADAHFNLAVALLQKEDTNGAMAQYQEALAINPAAADVRYNLGNALFAQGDWEQAVEQYRKAVEIKPDYADAHVGLGVVLLKKKDPEGAIAEYKKALEINSDLLDARLGLANALALKGDMDDAIAQYQEALAIAPAAADAHYNLGIVFSEKGNLEEAIRQYRKALELKPDDEAALKNLGDALLRHGELDEALAQYRKALNLNSEDVASRANLGKALLQKGDFDAALACFPTNAARSPDPLTRWRELGGALRQQGDLEEAILCYQQATRINPRSADAYADLGLTYFRKGEIQQAMDAWQQTLEIKPDQVPVLNNLAWLLATTPDSALRNGAKAVALAAQADQLSGGGNPMMLHTLAAAYAEEGSYGLAAVTARRALEMAGEQKNNTLAATLQKEIKLYEADTPVRDSTTQRSAPTVRAAPP